MGSTFLNGFLFGLGFFLAALIFQLLHLLPHSL